MICTVSCCSSKFWHQCQSKLSSDQADVNVAAALLDFRKQWVRSSMRESSGHASLALLEPAGPAVSAAIVPKILEDKLCSLGPSRALAVAAVPTKFAVVAGQDSSYTEKDGLASIRLSVQGSRLVAVARLSHLHGKFPGPPSTARQQCCAFLLQATPEQVRALIPGMCRGTVGAGDLLYVPAGCVVAESSPKGGLAADAMT
jgi:hypothetical protein